MRLSKKEKKAYLGKDPRIEDVLSSLVSQHRFPNVLYKETRHAVALARKFNEEVVKPVYKEIDRKVLEDHNYLPWEFIKKANEWGFYTLFIPKLFGGGGLNFLSMYPFIEEIGTVCVGLANVIGVHYLGIATQCASWNIRLMNKVWREVAKGERTGEPCLLSLAITEPDAGTDVEETDLLDKARLGTFAEKVKGGYIVNGRKIFISNGHVSKWHMLICYEDKKNPTETVIMFAVKNGTKGFSFGNMEKKMGQKACVASELVFEDCFIADEYVCASAKQIDGYKKSKKEIFQQLIDFVVSSSRAGVAAFGTGVARGSYETALNYAKNKKVAGELLINHQWAQCMLAEMYKNVNMSRTIYMESAYANGLSGMYKMLFKKPAFYFTRYMPKWYFTIFIAPLFKLKFVTWFFRKYYFDWYKLEEAELTSGWGSLVKFACSDLGIVNSNMAIELMGVDGNRHDIGAEKFLRDAKLLQIYEGTNQLNRLNLFKNLVGRDIPEVRVFD